MFSGHEPQGMGLGSLLSAVSPWATHGPSPCLSFPPEKMRSFDR